MSTKRKAAMAAAKKMAPRSLAIAKNGIKTGSDFASVFSALMSDLIEGRMDAQTGNAVCNAGGKLLKIVEMQYKYGKANPGEPERVLQLAPVAAALSNTVQ